MVSIIGLYSIHRTHFFNQNALYGSKIVTVLATPKLHDVLHLTEGLAFRIVNGIVRDAFDTKIVLEKLEPGVELFYGDGHYAESSDIGESLGGRIIVNNGRTFVFFASQCNDHMRRISSELGVDDEDFEEDEENDYRLRFPLPRMPYTFYVGEVKVKPGAADLKDGAMIEGVWWETMLEKYSHNEIFNELNFCVKGKWKVVAPFTEEDKAMNSNNNQNNDDGENFGPVEGWADANDDGEVEVWD